MDFDTEGFEILLEYLETLVKRHERGAALTEEETELLNLYLNMDSPGEYWEQMGTGESFFEVGSSGATQEFPLFESDALLAQGWEFMTSDPYDA